MAKVRYNVWHIRAYHGWYNCDGPEDCNTDRNFVFDASFTKEDVENAFCSQYSEDRVVEVWKCEKIASGEMELD